MTAAGDIPAHSHHVRKDVLVQQLLEISTRQSGRYALVALRGELDLADAAEVRVRLRRACEENDGRVVLDLSELMFVDSTGLSILVEYHLKSLAAGGRLILLAPSQAVTRVLDVTGLRERLKVCARLDELDEFDELDEADDIEEPGSPEPERAAEAEV